MHDIASLCRIADQTNQTINLLVTITLQKSGDGLWLCNRWSVEGW